MPALRSEGCSCKSDRRQRGRAGSSWAQRHPLTEALAKRTSPNLTCMLHRPSKQYRPDFSTSGERPEAQGLAARTVRRRLRCLARFPLHGLQKRQRRRRRLRRPRKRIGWRMRPRPATLGPFVAQGLWGRQIEIHLLYAYRNKNKDRYCRAPTLNPEPRITTPGGSYLMLCVRMTYP